MNQDRKILKESKYESYLSVFPQMEDHRVVGVRPLPCCGEGCLEETRKLFEEALAAAGSEQG